MLFYRNFRDGNAGVYMDGRVTRGSSFLGHTMVEDLATVYAGETLEIHKEREPVLPSRLLTFLYPLAVGPIPFIKIIKIFYLL